MTETRFNTQQQHQESTSAEEHGVSDFLVEARQLLHRTLPTDVCPPWLDDASDVSSNLMNVPTWVAAR